MIILKGKVSHTTQLQKTSTKKVEKERQQKKARCASIKQQKAKACTKLPDNLYSVSSAEEAHKLIEDFATQNTVKCSCYKDYKASKGFGGTGDKIRGGGRAGLKIRGLGPPGPLP